MRLFEAFRTIAVAGAVAAGVVGVAATGAAAQDLVITIDRVRALDRIDAAGQADFYAEVMINGKTTKTAYIRRADDVRPNWVIREKVGAGTHNVKVRILDRDQLSKDDLVDINRVDGKRDLDFQVRTRPTCRVLGFVDTFDCSRRAAVIKRAGTEKKSAEITFRVELKGR